MHKHEGWDHSLVAEPLTRMCMAPGFITASQVKKKRAREEEEQEEEKEKKKKVIYLRHIRNANIIINHGYQSFAACKGNAECI